MSVTTDFSTAPSGTFDSREAIERLEELEAEEDEETLEEDEREELEALRELAECAVEDWLYGATFVHEDHFEEYAKELAEDMGAIDSEATWPATCIDWEEAAKELQQDYTAVEFQGATYYVR